MAGKKKYFPNFHLPEGQNIDRGRMMVKEKNSDGRDSLPGRCKNRSRMSPGSNPAQTKGDEESNIGKRDLDAAVELRPAAFTLPATILLTTQKDYWRPRRATARQRLSQEIVQNREEGRRKNRNQRLSP